MTSFALPPAGLINCTNPRQITMKILLVRVWCNTHVLTCYCMNTHKRNEGGLRWVHDCFVYLGQDPKQEQPDSTGIAGTAGGAAGESQHAIVLSKGGVRQRASQPSKEAVDACMTPTTSSVYTQSVTLHSEKDCRTCHAKQQQLCMSWQQRQTQSIRCNASTLHLTWLGQT